MNGNGRGRQCWLLVLMILILLSFGLTVVYSITAYRGSEAYGDSLYYFKKQLLYAVVGLAIMALIAVSDYMIWLKASKAILNVITIIMFINMVVGCISGGSTRYFVLAGFSLAASEFAKVAILLYTADITMRMSKSVNSIKGLFKILWPALLCIFIMCFENLSNALICFVIMLAIVLVVCPKYMNVIALAASALLVFVIFIVATGFRMDKISDWLSTSLSGDDYGQVLSLYSINTGGLVGTGLSSSNQRLGFLTNAKGDVSFGVICQEWGILGMLLFVVAFALIVKHLYENAKRSNERFGGLLLTGIIVHLSLQVALNIAVAVGEIPSFGTYLPFVSYGASYMIVNLIEMGMALSVIREGN